MLQGNYGLVSKAEFKNGRVSEWITILVAAAVSEVVVIIIIII